MMNPRMVRRIFMASVLVLLALPAGGEAFGYWTGSGSGAGSATTGTADLTLSPGMPAADLYPGGTANVELTVSNPNASPLQVGSLALDVTQGTGGFAVDAGHAGCDVSTFSFATDTNGGVGWTVPGKVGAVNGTLPVTLISGLTMGEDAASACQGATTTVYLAAGP